MTDPTKTETEATQPEAEGELDEKALDGVAGGAGGGISRASAVKPPPTPEISLITDPVLHGGKLV